MRGVELIECLGAGTEFLFRQPVERRFHGAKVGVQVFGFRIEMQDTGHDFTGGLAFLQEIHGGDAVMHIVLGSQLA